MMPTFYYPSDPTRPASANEYWHFVYLHGRAERHNDEVAEKNGWEWVAPDLFVSDMPMPKEDGDYPANLYGLLVVAVLRPRYGLRCGRVGVPNDPNQMAEWRHVNSPEEWR